MEHVEGLTDEQLARIFQKLLAGGEADITGTDGRTIHITVPKVDQAGVQPHDWT